MAQLFNYNSPTYANTLKSSQLGNKPLYTDVVSDNYGNVKYYSGIDAEIYFEDIYIDEINYIQYQVQQNTLPLFGYNSYLFDDVAVGSRIIQGSFSLNFTKSRYLMDIFNTMTTIVNTIEKKNDVKSYELSQFKSNGKITKATQDPLTVQSKNPLWNKSFNIVVSYGDKYKQKKGTGSNYGTYGILTQVRLTGCSQQFGINGEPIAEVYTFIARDILPETKFVTDSKIAAANTNNKKEVITFKKLTYKETIENKKITGNLHIEYSAGMPITAIKTFIIPLSQQTIDSLPFDLAPAKNGVIDYKITNEKIRKDLLKSLSVNNTLTLGFAVKYKDGKTEKKLGTIKKDVAVIGNMNE